MIANFNGMPSNCGTVSGYAAHRRHNQEPCEDCKRAKSNYRKAQYQLNKERENQLHKIWRESNPEKMEEYRQKWIKTNPEKNRETKNAWRKRNPEYGRLKEHIRRARLYSVENDGYTESEVLETYGTDCHICLKPIDLEAPRRTNQAGWENGLHLDHLVSVAKGGSNTLENIRPAHGICNTRKGAKVRSTDG